MRTDIQDFVRSCPQCQTRKNPVKITRAPLIPMPIVEEPFDRIAIDVVGPLPQSESGNRFIVVCSDYLTRWPEAFAVPDTTAPTIARLFVENIVCRHGAPRVLLSDQGTNFLSKLVSEICQIVGTKQIKTSSYHPETDGLVERFNKTLATMISMYVNEQHKDWDEFLPLVLFAYRIQSS